MAKNECLPPSSVLKTVNEVAREMADFYQAAAAKANDSEARLVFEALSRNGREAAAGLACAIGGLTCDADGLVDASSEDELFLSALLESTFYRVAGRPAEIARQLVSADDFVEAALRLERDLLLFYTKFWGISCVQHRPSFSELIRRHQTNVTRLNDLRRDLKRSR